MPKKEDKLLLLVVILTVIFGIVMIYSASFIWAEYKFHDPFKFVKAQGMFFLVSLILVYFLKNINPSIYYKKANFILIMCFVLLVLVLIPGIGSVRN